MTFLIDRAAGGVAAMVPARLHLGFLDLNGGLGRRFGSIGLALDGLRTRLVLRKAEASQVSGPEAERASQHLATLEQHLQVAAAHDLHVEEAIPAHAGLGSGTQLALAVASALRRLHGMALDVRDDAALLARGARSGVGIGLFETGGFVVDAGSGPETSVPPIVSRMAFPEQWRIILVLDPRRRGLHGPGERSAFQALQPMAAADAGRLCRLVLMQVLPALAEHDLSRFGAAIKEMQAILGDYFAPQQGGRFTSREVGAVLDRLDGAGAHGIGQSSWGPTGFAFAPTQDDAERLLAVARGHGEAAGLDIRIASGLNHGAELTILSPSMARARSN